MINQSYKKQVRILYVFLLINPLLFYIYLSIQSQHVGQKVIDIVRLNPVMNIQLIFSFLIFFMGYILLKINKDDNISGVSILRSLVLMLVTCLLMRNYALAMVMAYFSFNFLKQYKVDKYKFFHTKFYSFEYGLVIILVFTLLLSVLILRMG